MSHCVPAKINFMRLLLLRMKMLKSEMLCFLRKLFFLTNHVAGFHRLSVQLN